MYLLNIMVFIMVFQIIIIICKCILLNNMVQASFLELFFCTSMQALRDLAVRILMAKMKEAITTLLVIPQQNRYMTDLLHTLYRTPAWRRL